MRTDSLSDSRKNEEDHSAGNNKNNWLNNKVPHCAYYFYTFFDTDIYDKMKKTSIIELVDVDRYIFY